MLPERAFRSVDAASNRLIESDFLAPRLDALLRQTSESRRVAAIAGRPLNPQPHTLTGDEWRTAWAEAHDAETDKALDAVY